MKKPFGFLLILFTCNMALAQTRADIKVLQQKEDSLKGYAVKIIQGINADNRFNADSMFTRVLVRALKTKNSFHYPFDSLQTVSILYSPDSVFRIFTWQLVINENVIRQHGAIQMKTYDGSLKLYGLIDKSDVTTNIPDTIGNNNGWIGAIYYKIIVKRSSNHNYYTWL
jgi:cell division protein FtsI/penicillin-binding protein 2